jgi:hypothetical protein
MALVEAPVPLVDVAFLGPTLFGVLILVQLAKLAKQRALCHGSLLVRVLRC